MNTLLKKFTLIFLVGLTCACNASDDKNSPYKASVILSDLDYPWSMAFLPNGDLLITERDGKLLRYSFTDKKLNTIKGLPDVFARGQGGLLGINVDSEFEKNQFIYFCYAAKDEDKKSGSEVVRAKLTDQLLTDKTTIFKARPKTKSSGHFGCRLQSDNQYLYISLGDKKDSEQAQSLSSHLGKIIRVHKNGSIPKDNPFVNTKFPEIYSYGHRNVQGLSLQADGTLWAHEHGPRGGDELNHIIAGRNYGWPKITYGKNYSGTTISEFTELPGLEQPIVYWVPSIAPSGLAIYNGNVYPQWQGDFFIGSMKFTHLHRVRLKDGKVIEQEELLKPLGHRIRDVKQGPDGYLYLLTDDSDGLLLRLELATK